MWFVFAIAFFVVMLVALFLTGCNYKAAGSSYAKLLWAVFAAIVAAATLSGVNNFVKYDQLIQRAAQSQEIVVETGFLGTSPHAIRPCTVPLDFRNSQFLIQGTNTVASGDSLNHHCKK